MLTDWRERSHDPNSAAAMDEFHPRPLPEMGPIPHSNELSMQASGAGKGGTGRDIALAVQGQVRGSYTDKQGQYLAFIYYYTKIHGRPPSEADMQCYFRVSPPAVHQMVVTLEKLRFIQRTPAQARSIKLLLPREQLPDLV